MQVKEILRRYHISPLRYEDGSLLEERDYLDLFILLQKYYKIKQIRENGTFPVLDEHLVNKVIKKNDNALIPFTEEELLDILMDVKTKDVI